MKTKILLMTLLSFFISGCQTSSSFISVEVEQFADIIKDPRVVVVDVRRAEEWNEGHLPQAQFNIDALKEDFTEQAEATLSKEKTLAIYCRSGRRSKDAASRLAKCGYKVIELNGGIISWQEKSMPVVK